MSKLPILEYPDPRLRKVAAPVSAVTPEVQKLVRDMAETMYAAPGIGLAATQVDVHKRVIVIDISETRDQLHVFINPELASLDGEAESEVDGGTDGDADSDGCAHAIAHACPCDDADRPREAERPRRPLGAGKPPPRP